MLLTIIICSNILIHFFKPISRERIFYLFQICIEVVGKDTLYTSICDLLDGLFNILFLCLSTEYTNKVVAETSGYHHFFLISVIEYFYFVEVMVR